MDVGEGSLVVPCILDIVFSVPRLRLLYLKYSRMVVRGRFIFQLQAPGEAGERSERSSLEELEAAAGRLVR